MLDWARGASLRSMIKANVSGAVHDDWLEGWMIGAAQHEWECRAPLQVLDVELGEGPRPYLDHYRAQGATVQSVPAKQLAAQQGEFGLVTMLSFERSSCLAPIDWGQPFSRIQCLLDAALLLRPGGVLFWSYLHTFAADPNNLHATLDPTAIYQCLILRGYRPLASDWLCGPESLTMYHHCDTLCVAHRAILEHGEDHRRVIRVFGAVTRPGAEPWVRRVCPEAAPRPASRPVPFSEVPTRQVARLLMKRLRGRFLRLLKERT